MRDCTLIIESHAMGEKDVSYYNRGYAYYQKGDYSRAIADYDQALRLDPKYAAGSRGPGHTYYKKGDYNNAIADSVSSAFRLAAWNRPLMASRKPFVCRVCVQAVTPSK